MAMSFMIRKTSHTVVPFALRAMASPRILTGSSTNALTREEHGLVRKSNQYFSTAALTREEHGLVRRSNQYFSTAALTREEHGLVRRSNQYFSTAALTREEHGLVRRSNQYLSTPADFQNIANQEEYIKILKSELKSAKRERDILLSQDLKVLQSQTNFPFEIEDFPGEGIIKLTRELAGEKIEVRVHGPKNICDDDDDDEKKGPERRKFRTLEPQLYLFVKISNENGKIWETAACTHNGHIVILIGNFSGGIFVKICKVLWMCVRRKADNRQEFWRDYLAARGIEDGIVDFLMEYMIRKYKRNQVQVLIKNIRKFETQH